MQNITSQRTALCVFVDGKLVGAIGERRDAGWKKDSAVLITHKKMLISEKLNNYCLKLFPLKADCLGMFPRKDLPVSIPARQSLCYFLP